jgi:Fe-S cluster biogenesis protein NfuA
MIDKVKEAILKIRPALQRDGGDIELVAVEGNIVKVRLKGSCACCPMSQVTLKAFVEKVIKQEVPGVEKVETA